MQEANAAYQADEQRDEVNALSEEMEAEARRRSIDFLVQMTGVLTDGGAAGAGAGVLPPRPSPR